MEKKIYTADELNNTSREEPVRIILPLQENTVRMMENQELILEQPAILRQQRFGRHSEKTEVIEGQMRLFFNEAEAQAGEPQTQEKEPELEEVVIRRKKKRRGKREDDLEGIPITIIRHDMSEDELRNCSEITHDNDLSKCPSAASENLDIAHYACDFLLCSWTFIRRPCHK